MFPFGHGLTYGKFVYSDLSVASTMAWDGELIVSAKVTNTGKRAAEELVQLYTHDRAASVTRPVRELKAFRKVTLAPGASEVVTFKIRRDLLLFIGRENKPTVEPGMFDVWVAPSAETQGVRGGFELKA